MFLHDDIDMCANLNDHIMDVFGNCGKTIDSDTFTVLDDDRFKLLLTPLLYKARSKLSGDCLNCIF